MFERFTDRARRVLVLAQDEARLLRDEVIGTEHLLLGMIHEGEGVAGQALAAVGVTLDGARGAIAGPDPRGGSFPTGSPPFSPRARKVLESALREALQLGHHYIGAEHLLLGLIRQGEGKGVTALVALGVQPADLRQHVLRLLSGGLLLKLETVSGGLVEAVDDAPEPADLVGESDAGAVLAGQGVVGNVQRRELEIGGVVYRTVVYTPRRLPEVSVTVPGARVSREAFDEYTARIVDAESVEGVGDVATWSHAGAALRVLAGSTLIVVQVVSEGDLRGVAVDVGRRAVAGLGLSAG